MNAPSPMISGKTSPRFAAVREAFGLSFADRMELGAALAVVVDGETVVDLWGGHRTLDRSQAWESDTLVNVWSVGKGVMALAIAMLADRGQLDYSAPVATYWPEFAANGKGAITVDQVMSHQAGLDGLNVPMADDGIFDWHRVVNALAAMAPLWPPGSRCVYHPLTYGFLSGELIRRIDGRSPGRFIAEEIAKPLKLDLHIGLAASDDARVAHMSAGDKAYDWVRQGEQSAYPHAFRNPSLDATAPTNGPGAQQRFLAAMPTQTPARSPACTAPWRAAVSLTARAWSHHKGWPMRWPFVLTASTPAFWPPRCLAPAFAATQLVSGRMSAPAISATPAGAAR